MKVVGRVLSYAICAVLALSVGQARAGEQFHIFSETCAKAVDGSQTISDLAFGKGYSPFPAERVAGAVDLVVWEYRDAGVAKSRIASWEGEAVGRPTSLCMLLTWGDWRDDLNEFIEFFSVSEKQIPFGYAADDAGHRFWVTVFNGFDVYLEFRTRKPEDHFASYSMTIGRLRGT